MRLTVIVLLVPELPIVYLFGVFAHQLIAKLCWPYLSVDTREAIQEILTPTNTSFAKMAFWADTVKRQPEYAWTRPLHFANLADHPPEFCSSHFTPSSPDNVVTTALNFSQKLLLGGSFEDLAFAVHFIMDLHMPLHLSGMKRGGLKVHLIDDQYVKKRKVSLHYLVDSLMLHRIIRVAPFNGSYSHFFKMMKQMRLKRNNCLKDVHDMQVCFEKWAMQCNLLNCQHFWVIPENEKVSTYVEMHKKAMLRLLRRAASNLTYTLDLIFAFQRDQNLSSNRRSSHNSSESDTYGNQNDDNIVKSTDTI